MWVSASYKVTNIHPQTSEDGHSYSLRRDDNFPKAPQAPIAEDASLNEAMKSIVDYAARLELTEEERVALADFSKRLEEAGVKDTPWSRCLFWVSFYFDAARPVANSVVGNNIPNGLRERRRSSAGAIASSSANPWGNSSAETAVPPPTVPKNPRARFFPLPRPPTRPAPRNQRSISSFRSTKRPLLKEPVFVIVSLFDSDAHYSRFSLFFSSFSPSLSLSRILARVGKLGRW